MKRLIVELHDVSPKFKDEVEYWVDAMPKEVKPVVGVVPYHDVKYDIRDCPEVIEIFDEFGEFELALHGYTHAFMEFKNKSLILTNDFIEKGMDMLSDVGYKPNNFIPPNWAKTLHTLTAIVNNDMDITSEKMSIRNLRLGKRVKMPIINCGMGDIPGSVDKAWVKMSVEWMKRFDKDEDFRLIYHPQRFPHFEKTIELINKFLDEGYKPITHSDLF